MTLAEFGEYLYSIREELVQEGMEVSTSSQKDITTTTESSTDEAA